MQRIQCAACSQWVSIAVEGTDKGIGILCPNHKNEITELRNQLEVKNQELQALRTEDKKLTTALNLKAKELKDLQAQIRALEMQLNEMEEGTKLVKKLEKTLNLVKIKLTKWINLIKHD